MNHNLTDLRPRRYQEEVFVQAQRSNIIAALETGSGKTYISTLLLKWISASPASQGKVVIFLVPKVALVEQQAEFIAKHSPLRVSKLHGALELDLTDREGWNQKFAQHDVFVMTAQIFLNLLTHSVWSLEKVSLMVFDECHHARKNHPFNSIMRVYTLTEESNRPKVFGMTASPIWNPKDPAGSLKELETNLDARTISVLENVDELVLHSPKPVETIQEYDFPREQYDYPSPTLWSCLSIFSDILARNGDSSWPEIERRHGVTLSNLGPYCASLYLYIEMQARIQSISTKEMVDDTDLTIVNEILSDFSPFFTEDTPIPLGWCTPKVKTLVQIIKTHVSPTFQGIIFVEQRQVAACLAKILPRISEIEGLVRCADLVGNTGNNDGLAHDMGGGNKQDSIKMFRQREINLLIATSVAEEGLDFPACDMVVRFDPLHHIVGYVQSRGRARNPTSKFIIMVQKDDRTYIDRYNKFSVAEPELKTIVQTRQSVVEDRSEDDEEMIHPDDLAQREQYVVSSTMAFVNYDNSINLIEHLCALIPHDQYTSGYLPAYTFVGQFESTLRLPSCLPLSATDLIYHGPHKFSKQEAKRAVAFMAVKRLHQLQVFDDYLLPVGSQKKGHKDADGNVIPKMDMIPVMLDVFIKDPWCIRHRLWIHALYVDDRPVAGLVTGSRFPASWLGGALGPDIYMCMGTPVRAQFDDEGDQTRLMSEYTRHMIRMCNTARPFTDSLALYLVPLDQHLQPDYQAIERFLAHPKGNPDWTGIRGFHYNKLLITERYHVGRTWILRDVRNDITPASPLAVAPYLDFPTYRDYFINKLKFRRWRSEDWIQQIPSDGPLLEVTRLSPSQSGRYPVNHDASNQNVSKPVLVPQGSSGWLDVSWDVCEAYKLLPSLCHRLTDVYRVRQLRHRLGLPAISEDLLVEALTLPSCNAGFSNQRLETLGDAVLEVCTTVHLLNKYPHLHEGQLTNIRQGTLSNKYLLSKALDLGLEQYVISEVQSVKTWRYVVLDDKATEGVSQVLRRYPRRALQDCMEAMLGAAFVTGGISMALLTGVSLGMAFGGGTPWPLRYKELTLSDESSVPSLFASLQKSLGYSFRVQDLLREAITHPSFESDCPSYQRLEFLGDAILNLVVVNYLYEKFPNANSNQLALPRTKAVCSSALAWLAVRLGLHKIVLINNVDLSIAIGKAVPQLTMTSADQIVRSGWRYDPPKALSDIFESVIGAILIDTHYDFEKTSGIVEYLMAEILQVLSPAVQVDPVSELNQWTGKAGCRIHPILAKATKGDRIGIEVRVHDHTIVGPIVSTSLSVARAIAAQRALSVLKDPTAVMALQHICSCSDMMKVDGDCSDQLVGLESDASDLED